jgi:alpha-galactosidase
MLTEKHLVCFCGKDNNSFERGRTCETRIISLNVIARCITLKNGTKEPIYIRKLMSFMFNMPTADYKMLTLDGGWAKKAASAG